MGTRRTMRRRTTMRRTTTRATTWATMRTTTTRRRIRRRTNDGVRSIYADLRVVWRRLSHRLAIRQWRLLEASRAYQIGGNTSEGLPRSACLLIVIVSRQSIRLYKGIIRDIWG